MDSSSVEELVHRFIKQCIFFYSEFKLCLYFCTAFSSCSGELEILEGPPGTIKNGPCLTVFHSRA